MSAESKFFPRRTAWHRLWLGSFIGSLLVVALSALTDYKPLAWLLIPLTFLMCAGMVGAMFTRR
jgi:hypothetical protein